MEIARSQPKADCGVKPNQPLTLDAIARPRAF